MVDKLETYYSLDLGFLSAGVRSTRERSKKSWKSGVRVALSITSALLIFTRTNSEFWETNSAKLSVVSRDYESFCKFHWDIVVMVIEYLDIYRKGI